MFNIDDINHEIISNKIIDQYLRKLEKLQSEKAALKAKQPQDEKTAKKIGSIQQQED
jgi:hypothetical protein